MDFDKNIVIQNEQKECITFLETSRIYIIGSTVRHSSWVNCTFQKSFITNSTLSDIDFRCATFSSTIIADTLLESCNFSYAQFNDCTFLRTEKFYEKNLTSHTTFYNCLFYDIGVPDLDTCDFKDCTFLSRDISVSPTRLNSNCIIHLAQIKEDKTTAPETEGDPSISHKEAPEIPQKLNRFSHLERMVKGDKK